YGFQFAGLVGDLKIGGKVAWNKGTLVGAQHLEEIVGKLLVQHFSVIDGIEQGRHFTRGGDVLAALLGGLKVHHFAAQASVGQAERVEHGVDVLHAHTVDEYVGGGVIADGHRHGGQIAEGDAGDSGREAVHDVAIGDQVGGLHGVEISELELAL